MPKFSLKNGNLYYGNSKVDTKTNIVKRNGYTKKVVYGNYVESYPNNLRAVVQDVDKTGKPNKHGYIGGTTEEARKKYWEQNPIIRHATDSIANAYNISPELLRHRLDVEGFTDESIRTNNRGKKENYWSNANNYAYLNDEGYNGIGFDMFGLDDGATYITEGKVNPINETWSESRNDNEKGRVVRTSDGKTIKDNIGLTAAHLKYFRDKAAKDFPGLGRILLDEAANMYYQYGPNGGKKIMKKKIK